MIRLVVLALCLATACSQPAPEVGLRRVGGACGAAGDARTLLVRALGGEREETWAVSVGEAVTLSNVPASTRQFSVETLGAGGAVRTVGKTAPLTLRELEDGDDLPIAMIPPGGFCPTEPMLEARTAPAIARAGRYVLLFGGEGASRSLTTAELYDPETDRFESIEVLPRLTGSGHFIGASVTALADGRAVVMGGPTGVFMIFDPQTKSFGFPIFLERRFFHGALALTGDQLVVAGGCRELAGGGGCDDAMRTVYSIAVDSNQQQMMMGLTRDHVQPTLLLDPGGIGGVSGDRGPGVLVVGAVTESGLPAEVADRIDLVSSGATAVPGSYAVATTLDSGAVLTGFSAAGLDAINNIAVLPPQTPPRTMMLGAPPALRSASLTTLEDGTVLALGQDGTDAPAAALFRPTRRRWQPVALPAELTSLVGHRAVLLDDGSVLVVGASDANGPSRTAFRFRPSLLGPNAFAALPLLSDDRAELTPSDPTALVEGSDGRFELVGSRAGLSQWAVVGGPRLTEGRLSAVVRFPPPPGPMEAQEPRGLAVLTHFVSPAQLLATELVAGQRAVLTRHAPPVAGGISAATVLCRGDVVPDLSSAGPVSLELTVRGDALVVRLAGAELLACTLAESGRGAWGLGVVGASARLGIDTLTVER